VLKSAFRERWCKACKKPHRSHKKKSKDDNRLLKNIIRGAARTTSKTYQVIEFHQQDTCLSLYGICKKHKDFHDIDVYSDLELRTLCLAHAVILGEPFQSLINGLWPERGHPLLRLESQTLTREDLDGKDIQGLRPIWRKFRAKNQGILAYLTARQEPEGQKNYRPLRWMPANFHHKLAVGTEVLLITIVSRETDNEST
jgi:hypothetical protein